MSTIAFYSLGSFGAVLALAGAFWVGRLLSRPYPDAKAVREALARQEELEIIFQTFAAQFELTINRDQAKLGKLRRALARERGEEEEEPEPETVPDRQVTDFPNTKAALRIAARQQGITR